MKLKLTKIRQHKTLVAEFPDKGIVRIKGASGAGKTTVFDAVRQLLFGDVQGLTHWDESSSKIEGEWLGMKLTRTMRPNAFRVEKDGRELVDDEAQAEVYRALDMTSEEFMASSYIQQEFAESLLTLTPADQLRLIQRLAFGDDDPEFTKAKILTLIAQREVRVSIAEHDLERTTAALEAASAALASAKPAPKPLLPSNAEMLEQAKVVAEKDHATATKALKCLRDEAASGIYALMDTLERRKQALNEARSFNLPIIEAAKDRLTKIPAFENLPGLRARESQLLVQRQAFETRSKAMDAMKTVAARYPGRPKDVKLFDYVVSELDRIKAQEALCQESIKSVEEQLAAIERAKAALKCPACQVSLRYVRGSLETHDHAPSDGVQEASLHAEVASIRKTLLELKSEQTSLLTDRIELANQKAILDKTPAPPIASPEALETELAFAQEEIAKAKSADALRKGEDTAISTAERAIKVATEACQTAKAALAGNAKPRPKETVLLELSEAQDAQENAQKALTEATNAVIDLTKAKAALAQWEAAQESITRHQKALEAATHAHKEASAAQAAAKDDHTAALRLKEISDRAALDAIASMFQSINFNAKPYIDLMFPDTGTQVSLRNTKELKSGEERAKPSLQVFHKGSVAKNFKELSGGEKGRIRLAFHLALSDLYKSPILLVDEPFTGMDAASRELALSCLENITANKLILIIDHNLSSARCDYELEVGDGPTT